jgi:DnaJ family protein C protein 2
MEKENKKKREEEKKADTKRIKQFIGLAEDTDPRVIAKRREEKEAREAKKLAKGAGRREAEAAAAKAAEEAAAKAAEEAEKAKVEKAAAKKELEKQKKALRKEKARLRENAARAAGADGYPGALDFDGIKKLNDALDAITDGAGIVAAVNQALADAGKA